MEQVRFKKILVAVCASLFWILASAKPVLAQAPREMPRRILALYDAKSYKNIYHTPIHRHLEIVLNHLGLKVTYRPVSDPLPSDEEMRDVRGVLSWFYSDEVLDNPSEYCAWLSKQMNNGVRWVALNRSGLQANGAERLSPVCQQTFKDLGVQYVGENTLDELFIEMVEIDPRMVEFERQFNFTEGVRYALIRPLDDATRVYLKLKRTDLDDSVSSLVFTTKRGGYAHAGAVVFENRDINKIKWRLNPFLFMEEALGLKGLPRPDVTTLNGTRVFMTHIDGDGIFNVSHIDRKSFSGEIILEKILKFYADLPFSVSIITGYLDMPEFQTARAMRLYGDIFGLDNVEVASHGHAHPLVWQSGKVALEIPGYDYDPKFEIQGSVTKVRELLKTLGIEKTVDTFFWTGDCLPTAEQISYADDFGLLNINGGDSRYDHIYDSYAFLSPHGLNREGSQQVFASFPNENVFTNLWKGPFYGFRDLVESFRNTEEPFRLKALDVYYHFYSGERIAALNALELAYHYAVRQPIFPVYTSDYARIVMDFYGAQITQLSESAFVVQNQGWMKTVRFDREKRAVDLQRSRGVIGFQHYQDNLYVSLDDSLEHEIHLANVKPSQPYVEQATFHVKNWSGDRSRLEFEKKGWHKSRVVLRGLLPLKTYTVQDASHKQNVIANEEGALEIEFQSVEKSGPWTKVSVSLESIEN